MPRRFKPTSSIAALAISLGALANAAMLLVGLKRRGIYRPLPGWGGFVARLAVALALLAVLLWAANRRIDWIALHAHWPVRAGLLAAVIAGAMAAYFGALWLMGFRPREFLLRLK
jgi:putative peptidoglycan lipid II flippase